MNTPETPVADRSADLLGDSMENVASTKDGRLVEGWYGSQCNRAEILRQDIVNTLFRWVTDEAERDDILMALDELSELAGAKLVWPEQELPSAELSGGKKI